MGVWMCRAAGGSALSYQYSLILTLSPQVLTDRVPYGDASTDTAVSIAIINRESPHSLDNLQISEAIRGMLQSCWAFEPSLRWPIVSCLDVVDPEESSSEASNTASANSVGSLREKVVDLEDEVRCVRTVLISLVRS